MQKDKGWTAGLISKKISGLSAKNWAWLELFLNRLGRRVYFKEVGGLFSKRAGLKRYLQIRAIGSRSDGSDWIGPRSNRDRWNRIGGPWEFGRVGRRRDSPESISRGGAAPEKAKLAFQSSKRGAAWPGRKLVARVNFLWGCWGSERPRAGRSRVVAARRGEVSPECGD